MSLLKNSKIWATLALIASLICVSTMLYALMGVREGWEGAGFREASETIRTALEFGAGVFVFSIVVLILGRRTKNSLITSAIAALLVCIPIVIAFSVQPEETTPTAPTNQQAAAMGGMGGTPNGMGSGTAGARAPALNDISTDTLDPPRFNAVAAIRPEGSNTLQYPTNGATLQKQLFPDIAPIKSDLSKTDAFKRALALAEKKGWEIVDADESTGIIEAVSSTFFFSYEDDIVIRVRAQDSGSIVDIRSHSRIGRGDRGKNAERVRDYINQF